MDPATRIELRDGADLLHWSQFDPETRVDFACSCVVSGGEFALVDPFALAASTLADLGWLGSASGVIATNGNHERATAPCARALRTQTWAPDAVRGEWVAERWYSDGDVLPLAARAVALPGFGPGECALHFEGLGLLVIGDAAINLPQTGFALLPEKYCEDPCVAARSIRKLADLEFDTIAFAHGAPITVDAKSRLASLWGSS